MFLFIFFFNLVPVLKHLTTTWPQSDPSWTSLRPRVSRSAEAIPDLSETGSVLLSPDLLQASRLVFKMSFHCKKKSQRRNFNVREIKTNLNWKFSFCWHLLLYAHIRICGVWPFKRKPIITTCIFLRPHWTIDDSLESSYPIPLLSLCLAGEEELPVRCYDGDTMVPVVALRGWRQASQDRVAVLLASYEHLTSSIGILTDRGLVQTSH